MPSTALLALPRELRDMLIQYVLHSSQPELGFDQRAYSSRDFIVTSARTIAPANLLWTCRQMREETLYLMRLWDRNPRLEIHMKKTRLHWEICTAWSVPPSACIRLKKRNIESLTVDLKPRNEAESAELAQASDPRRYYPTSRSLWQDDLFSCSSAGDYLGYLVSRAVQRLGANDSDEEIREVTAHAPADSLPQLRHVSHIQHNSDVVVKRLYLNICRDERYPDEQLPDCVTRGIRGDVLSFMYRCVSSSVSCCPDAVKMVDQEDGLKQLMCYCQHRLMWYTQVGNITIAQGSESLYEINLGNMLGNDIKTTQDSTCRSYLQELMSLRERRCLECVHRAGTQSGFARYTSELPAVTFF